ncbi:MAG TPA: ABC transporter substrate-binding protein, partial [Paracoccaceae bacterium]|nr:ABC transporter substrate-binding protein [Paracoccaceae bacterium]
AVLRVINSGKAEAAMLVDFEGIFRSYADVPRIAGVSLGAPWRTATSAQKAGYVEAFQGYLARKYGRQFRKFAGAKIDIVRSRDGGRKGVLVLSMIDLPGDTPFEVEWQVIEVSGTPKMFDLIIEGISMLASERSEIGAMLEKRGGDIDRLIADLKST